MPNDDNVKYILKHYESDHIFRSRIIGLIRENEAQKEKEQKNRKFSLLLIRTAEDETHLPEPDRDEYVRSLIDLTDKGSIAYKSDDRLPIQYDVLRNYGMCWWDADRKSMPKNQNIRTVYPTSLGIETALIIREVLDEAA